MGWRQQRAQRSFDEYVSTVADGLFRTALLLSGDWQHAEDLVQTTLAKVFSRGIWHRSEYPEAYVRKMLTNEFLSLKRRRSSRELPVEVISETAFGHFAESDPTLRVDLFRALALLSPADRAVVVLRYWDDLSITDTANLLDVSEGAVRSRSGRALAKLRSILTDKIPTPVGAGHGRK